MTTADLRRAGDALDVVRAELGRREAGEKPDARFDPALDVLLDLLDEVQA